MHYPVDAYYLKTFLSVNTHFSKITIVNTYDIMRNNLNVKNHHERTPSRRNQ